MSSRTGWFLRARPRRRDVQPPDELLAGRASAVRQTYLDPFHILLGVKFLGVVVG